MIMEITGISVPLQYESARTGDVRDSLADIRRAQEAFGYAPGYTIKTGLEETITWYRNR
jgi:UDP-glucose 4-epimerase